MHKQNLRGPKKAKQAGVCYLSSVKLFVKKACHGLLAWDLPETVLNTLLEIRAL